MQAAIDTNVLLAFTQRIHAKHTIARNAIREMTLRGERLHILPQNIIEFWGVMTRPAAVRGGFGNTPSEADKQMRLLEKLFVLLPDISAVYLEWQRIVGAYGVSGVQVHDARIAAALQVYGVNELLTFNTSDFARYPHLTAIDPANV